MILAQEAIKVLAKKNRKSRLLYARLCEADQQNSDFTRVNFAVPRARLSLFMLVPGQRAFNTC